APGQRGPRELPAVPEVAAGDEVSLGMLAEPGLAAPQELLDLVRPDPVVLRVVEDREEHVQMLEHPTDRGADGERRVEVPARAPLREAFVELDRLRGDAVSERLEQPAQERLAPAAGAGPGAPPPRPVRARPVRARRP